MAGAIGGVMKGAGRFGQAIGAAKGKGAGGAGKLGLQFMADPGHEKFNAMGSVGQMMQMPQQRSQYQAPQMQYQMNPYLQALLRGGY